MRPMEDADKNGWAAADFNVMMVAVDLGSQQIGRIDCDCQINCHCACFIVINHQTCDPLVSVHHNHSQTYGRANFMLIPTATPLATYARTLSSQIMVMLDSIRLKSC
ncbi:hypothetical protein TNCV_2313871 [Trichonephila clavipes]|nr:hypothetical protein TNCV_2313871 [Trichonephila clavipes]